jgi:hypothetical protein
MQHGVALLQKSNSILIVAAYKNGIFLQKLNKYNMSQKEQQLAIIDEIIALEKQIATTRKKFDKALMESNDYKVKLYHLREDLRNLQLKLIEVSRPEKVDN